MIATRILHFIALALLVACSSTGQAAETPLQNELDMLVGADARECGFVALGQDPAVAWDCAKKADGDDSPYWVAIERQGIDSDVWIAALLTPSGVRYILMYDSNYMGGPGLLPRFTREACVGQLVLDMERQKIIQCLRSK